MSLLGQVYSRRVAWEEGICTAMREAGITNPRAIVDAQPVAVELCWREGKRSAESAAFILDCHEAPEPV